MAWRIDACVIAPLSGDLSRCAVVADSHAMINVRNGLRTRSYRSRPSYKRGLPKKRGN